MVQEYGLFFGGKWRKSDGKRFETHNPATGETLATFPLATKDELNQAVRHAKEAFDKWKKTPAPRRGELLLEAARICRRKKEVLDEAGFPPGVVNMLTGSGAVVGDGLVAHPDIRAISFTGGVDTGKHVYESAAKKMIKVGLELGGKNPIIAMDDANVDLLMDGVMFGAFGTAGQRCTAASRLIVHQKVYDRVVDELVERAEKLRVGNPIDEKTDMGPVASADQEKKVLEYIEIGRNEGDKLLTGGQKLKGGAYDRGFFISPTVFAVDRKKRLAQEEIFGPVLSVLKAKDYEDAVAIANSVKYGLSSSIYTNDLRWAFRAMHELEAGITYVNAPTIGAEVQLPFGGTKETGPTDTREAGTTALEEFTYWKTVYVDYSGRLQRAQIDTEKLVGS